MSHQRQNLARLLKDEDGEKKKKGGMYGKVKGGKNELSRTSQALMTIGTLTGHRKCGGTSGRQKRDIHTRISTRTTRTPHTLQKGKEASKGHTVDTLDEAYNVDQSVGRRERDERKSATW